MTMINKMKYHDTPNGRDAIWKVLLTIAEHYMTVCQCAKIAEYCNKENLDWRRRSRKKRFAND